LGESAVQQNRLSRGRDCFVALRAPRNDNLYGDHERSQDVVIASEAKQSRVDFPLNAPRIIPA
jgi:hypothetical protein